jgi:DNA-binding CsgD family transcriptional regulator
VTSLTANERQVLALIGSGMSTEEIAAQLGVHVNTVKNRVRALKDKLGVDKRRHLAAIARDHA